MTRRARVFHGSRRRNSLLGGVAMGHADPFNRVIAAIYYDNVFLGLSEYSLPDEDDELIGRAVITDLAIRAGG